MAIRVLMAIEIHVRTISPKAIFDYLLKKIFMIMSKFFPFSKVADVCVNLKIEKLNMTNRKNFYSSQN